MNRERSPGMKLFMAGLVAAMLIVPLMMVYALVWDRDSQSQGAQAQIEAGCGGAQTITGPLLVIPYTGIITETETANGQQREVRRSVERELFVSPARQQVETSIDPDRKGYAIYQSVVYQANISGSASFVLDEDLARLGVTQASLRLDQAELRFGISDPRGLADGARVRVGEEALRPSPGNGPAATGGSGFSAPVAWDGAEPLQVSWQYGLRGSRSLALVPRGGEIGWAVTSPWPHPSFTGSFLPDQREVGAAGFTASYAGITNLALGQRLLSLEDGTHEAAPVNIGLVDPVDLYSQVDRAVKYGFLFIGFTFAAFLMFDLLGGARVAAAEYLLTGAGLVLFFVMLLAFAELIGFGAAYVVAAAAIIGLLTAYSAAVLASWRRAGFVGGLLAGLYALLFVLLSMETYSLVIGSLLLFFALAGIMYGTRNIDWAQARRLDDVVTA